MADPRCGQKIRLNPEAAASIHDDGLVVFHVPTGRLFTSNRIGARVSHGQEEPNRFPCRAYGLGNRSKGLFRDPWLEALRPLARDLLKTRRTEVVERGFVDRQSFFSRLERLSAGLESNEAQLRRIVILEFWLRHRAANSLVYAARRLDPGNRPSRRGRKSLHPTKKRDEHHD